MADAPTILVVDDDPFALRMMRRVLERRDYTVIEAPDGATALNMVRTDQPDAVVLDLRMPGEHSGLDVAAALRADEAYAELPIIACSASVHVDARQLTEQAGCSAFIAKPVEFGELYATLARLGVHPPA